MIVRIFPSPFGRGVKGEGIAYGSLDLPSGGGDEPSVSHWERGERDAVYLKALAQLAVVLLCAFALAVLLKRERMSCAGFWR